MADDPDDDILEGEGEGPQARDPPNQLMSFGVGPVRSIRRMVQTVLQPLNMNLECFPVAMMPGNERHDLENGGKIILPPSVLQHLTRLNISYPMLFRLTHPTTEQSTHCGVLEFIAEYNKCYLPLWMMKNLHLHPGDSLQIQSATLPVAQFAKFEPQSVDFLDITNPKAILENALRNWNCLTTGDLIAIMYNGKLYELNVLETQPGPAVSIIECDMDVDFAPPVGYVEPERNQPGQSIVEGEAGLVHPENAFVPFAGSGNRLDGKDVTHSPGQEVVGVKRRRGVPAYNYAPGSLHLPRNFQYFTDRKAKADQKDNPTSFVPFSGGGFTLKPGNGEQSR